MLDAGFSDVKDSVNAEGSADGELIFVQARFQIEL